MRRTLSRRFVNVASRIGLIALTLAAAGCSETYLAHRDTLSPGSGDALAGDLAKQVINPWPAAAFDDRLITSGERLQHAMERYNNPSSGTSPAVPNAAPIPVVK